MLICAPYTADPDRSNPTRNRWERPLDTIRSFEAAIDGGYSNRRSIIRAGTADVTATPAQGHLLTRGATDTEGPSWGSNRRSSYYGGSTQFRMPLRTRDDANLSRTDANGGRFGHDSYYGSRPPSTMYANRGEGSQQDLRMGHRDAYYDQQGGYGGYGPPPQNGRRGFPRMASEPQYGSAYRQQGAQDYPFSNNHRSYETVTTASGSGSSGEPAGYQTDPTSSDNSSIERVQTIPRRQPEPSNDYGIGFNSSPTYQSPTFTVGIPNPGMNGSNGGFNNYQVSGESSYASPAPPVPHKDATPVLRKPVSANQGQQMRPAQLEKRKSWFSRRFSKNG